VLDGDGGVSGGGGVVERLEGEVVGRARVAAADLEDRVEGVVVERGAGGAGARAAVRDALGEFVAREQAELGVADDAAGHGRIPADVDAEQEELLRRFGPVEDPVIEARRQRILDFLLLETSPQKKQQLIATGLSEGRREGQQEGRLTATRAALRRVLAGRQLAPSKDDDACSDLTTLERWLDQAINAASISDVLG
jgi:hypothetical protein